MNLKKKKPLRHLIIIYCLFCSYSCGYRKAFEEYANLITDRYPQISIEGANYDPPGMNFLLSKAILAVKMIFILIIVSQYDIWGQIGQAVPRWFTWCVENKIYACMMVFFVGNMLEAQVIQSNNSFDLFKIICLTRHSFIYHVIKLFSKQKFHHLFLLRIIKF